MAKKKLTEEQKKEISLLLATNQMLEDAKADTENHGRAKQVEQIERARQETLEHIKMIDPSYVPESKPQKTSQESLFSDTDMSIFEPRMVQESPAPTTNISEPEEEASINDIMQTETIISDDKTFNDVDPSLQYDVIPLPSNGQAYKNKLARVPVAYLTAYDENIITSPNLYRDGLVIDFLLKNKIVNNAISPDDLLSGDADAITLFLRSTSYGPDFPVSVIDPETGEQIDTTVDLSKIKYRDFKLVSDENGYFDYVTQGRKDLIKFRYLTRKHEKMLQKQTELETFGTKAFMLDKSREGILNAMKKTDGLLNESERKSITSAMAVLANWSKKLKEKNNSNFNRMVTNIMLAQIVSVNGNYDRDFIQKYVYNMPARESMLLRNYIADNKPGVDFNIEIERPESLGGGSFKTFLNWDDDVFLNIPQS